MTADAICNDMDRLEAGWLQGQYATETSKLASETIAACMVVARQDCHDKLSQHSTILHSTDFCGDSPQRVDAAAAGLMRASAESEMDSCIMHTGTGLRLEEVGLLPVLAISVFCWLHQNSAFPPSLPKQPQLDVFLVSCTAIGPISLHACNHCSGTGCADHDFPTRQHQLCYRAACAPSAYCNWLLQSNLAHIGTQLKHGHVCAGQFPRHDLPRPECAHGHHQRQSRGRCGERRPSLQTAQ